jgi:tetratricopeptide (TPR) repeat protein
MKKKIPAKVKSSPSKSHKKQGLAKRPAHVAKVAPPAQPHRSHSPDAGFQQTVQNYEAGLRAMQEHKFEKAKALLQKVVAGPSRELADRAAVHLNTCNQKLSRSSTSFKTVEEHYDYSVSLMNVGDFVSAREHLEKVVKQAPKADYVWYGLAVLDCLTGHFEESLRHLAEAIRLNPANRFQARNDSDFHNLADDPRFTELLYPEPTTDAPAGYNPFGGRR